MAKESGESYNASIKNTNLNDDDISKSSNGERNSFEWGDNIFLSIIIVIGIIVGILLFLYLLRKFIQGGQYRKKNRIDGKVCIITGCNTGIGKQTALELAKRGGKIYMACRDTNKCEEARLQIVEESKNNNVFNRTLDLSSFESIRNFVQKFLEEESRLDILINNAGIMAPPKSHTKDGFEIQIGVNHLGHFLLTKLLLDTLKASAPSRIVVVASVAYLNGRIKRDDLNSEKNYNRFWEYSQSKLANILFTKHLSKILHGTNVTVNCLHPGIVKTELSRSFMPSNVMKFLHPVTTFFFKSALSGAQTTIKLAIDPDLEKVSGEYFSDCIRMPLLPKARNEETAEWLWNISEEWTTEGGPKKIITKNDESVEVQVEKL